MSEENTTPNELPDGEAVDSSVLLAAGFSEAPTAGDSGPLRFVVQINGRLRVLGVWTLKAQEGFPLDMSCHTARDKGFDIDWVEVIADACNRREFNALEKEVEILLGDRLEYLTRDDWHNAFRIYAMGKDSHGSDKSLYDHMWRDRPSLSLANAVLSGGSDSANSQS